jgi:hypothetical protein
MGSLDERLNNFIFNLLEKNKLNKSLEKIKSGVSSRADDETEDNILSFLAILGKGTSISSMTVFIPGIERFAANEELNFFDAGGNIDLDFEIKKAITLSLLNRLSESEKIVQEFLRILDLPGSK